MKNLSPSPHAPSCPKTPPHPHVRQIIHSLSPFMVLLKVIVTAVQWKPKPANLTRTTCFLKTLCNCCGKALNNIRSIPFGCMMSFCQSHKSYLHQLPFLKISFSIYVDDHQYDKACVYENAYAMRLVCSSAALNLCMCKYKWNTHRVDGVDELARFAELHEALSQVVERPLHQNLLLLVVV